MHGGRVPRAGVDAFEMLRQRADDLLTKHKDRVELALNRFALTITLGRHVEEPGDEFTDARRQSDEEIGHGDGRHAFAATAAIVLILAVQACERFCKLRDERIVQALQPLGSREVLVGKSGDTESQALFFVIVPVIHRCE